MNLIPRPRYAKHGDSIAGAHHAVQWFGRLAPRLLARPRRLEDGCGTTIAEVHAAAVVERDVARDVSCPMRTVGPTMARCCVSTFLTLSVLALAALSVGCDSLRMSKMAAPMPSQGLCFAPADSLQVDHVSSQSGADC